MNLNLFWRISLLLATFAILVLSLMPAPPQSVNLGWDKANHAFAMAVVTFLAVYSKSKSPRALFSGALYAFSLGCVIEVLQALFTTTRKAEWGDIAADMVGILFAVVILFAIQIFPSIFSTSRS